MSDSNATELLRSMLDERGVEYTTELVGQGTLFTIWVDEERAYYVLVRHVGIDMWSNHFTPEQAVAATLGAGRLTVEQVRAAYEKHYHDLPSDYDMPEATALPKYSYGWTAIADELNTTLGADDGSRWYELFGTPERAAKTLIAFCDECDPLNNNCNDCRFGKFIGFEIFEKDLLEWLRGKAVS